MPGRLEGIDRVLALHVWTGLPVGQVAVRPGVMWASADEFTLIICGRGGHGAQPHLTVDAVVIAAQVISALQTLVSRESSPTAPAVVTIGSIQGGTAPNIIAGEVILRGTLRVFDARLRETLLIRIPELAGSVARGLRGSAEFVRGPGAPPVVNDGTVAALVAEAAREAVGDAGVTPFEPLMVAEDVSYFLEERPGCFFLLGAAPEGAAVVHHTADFRVNERCLPIGLEVMAGAIRKLLET